MFCKHEVRLGSTTYYVLHMHLMGRADMAGPAALLLAVTGLAMFELLRVFECVPTGVVAKAAARRVVTPTLLVGSRFLAVLRLAFGAAAGVVIGIEVREDGPDSAEGSDGPSGAAAVGCEGSGRRATGGGPDGADNTSGPMCAAAIGEEG